MPQYSPHKRIGFLATGSELVYGEILNTNGQKMAQACLDMGIEVGEHIIVDDGLANIEAGLKFLLERHDCVITSGGLGPTSDDITRNGIANVLNLKLNFDNDSWERIVERMSKRNVPIPESNRQQAYFPEGGTILPNENGTADGCGIEQDGKWIFMLPGPPRECLPIFEQKILPTLRENSFATNKRLFRWRLMGASESHMAEILEAEFANDDIEFAYRAAYPYLDVKLHLDEGEDLDGITDRVYQIVKANLVTTENTNISTILKHALLHYPTHLTICDLATKEAFASELVTPGNHHKLQFVDQDCDVGDDHAVTIRGLDEFWNTQPDQYSTFIELELKHDGKSEHFKQEIYLRGSESMEFAIEFVSHRIYQKWFQN